MTALARRKPKPRLVVTVAVTADPETGVRVPLSVVFHGWAIAVVTAWATVVRVAISVKTGGPVSAMRLFGRNVRPWNGPKCRCESWPHKPMVKP